MGEAMLGSTATNRYTPEYVTHQGTKVIDFYGTPTRVHNVPNLPDLLDTYFNAQAGIGPRNAREAEAYAKLSHPEVAALLDYATRLNPSFTTMLAALTEVRAQESEAGIILPEDEQTKRDFIYSSAWDHIGDAATHSGELHLLHQIA